MENQALMDCLGSRFDEVLRRLDRIEARTLRRRAPIVAVKRRHVTAMLRKGRHRCPCCELVNILDEFGNPLSTLEWDHWYAPHRARVNEVWPVCSDCNRRFEAADGLGSRWRRELQVNFEKHQLDVDRYGDDDQPGQMRFHLHPRDE